MEMNIKSVTIPLSGETGKNKEIIIETGKLAKQADGAVTVRLGDTVLLATVVYSRELKNGVDFLPLTVDYREKFYAAGRIPGGFTKREGRPSDEEILTMRLIDRVLRPLFPDDFHLEVQVMVQLISYGGDFRPAALAGLAASAAVSVSGLPLKSPISEVQIARVDDQWVIYPSPDQLEVSSMDMIVGASHDSIIMVEGEMRELSEDQMLEAIEFAHQVIKPQVEAQFSLARQVQVQKIDYPKLPKIDALLELVQNLIYEEVYSISKSFFTKQQRSAKYEEVQKSLIETLANNAKEQISKEGVLQEAFSNVFDQETQCIDEVYVQKCFKSVCKKAVRDMALEDGLRLDGRSFSDIRPIWSEVDLLPSVHGSAVFTRGETQSLVGVALGTGSDANRIDDVSLIADQKFYLHYNFPPFSTGECRPIRGVSRREVGHGNLAFRALSAVFPYDTPYTVRVVSEILESNGSSSMATVCAGSMALMDAGIAMSVPVSGIAMGLITEGDKSVVLSDILGDEDHLGDMDFKVAGTSKGITACQMDIKVSGISFEVLKKALYQARDGRLSIMEEMSKTISSPRSSVKSFAPKIEQLQIQKKFIGGVIGPGGKVIQEIQKRTGTHISIKEEGEIGMVEVLGVSLEGIQTALAEINKIAFVPSTGQTYDAEVVGVKPFGLFVKLLNTSVEGLVHISEVSHQRISNLEELFRLGDKTQVKMIGIDSKTQKIRLSIKQANEKV